MESCHFPTNLLEMSLLDCYPLMSFHVANLPVSFPSTVGGKDLHLSHCPLPLQLRLILTVFSVTLWWMMSFCGAIMVPFILITVNGVVNVSWFIMWTVNWQNGPELYLLLVCWLVWLDGASLVACLYARFLCITCGWNFGWCIVGPTCFSIWFCSTNDCAVSLLNHVCLGVLWLQTNPY